MANKKCEHGDVDRSPRGVCRICARARNQKYADANRDKLRAKNTRLKDEIKTANLEIIASGGVPVAYCKTCGGFTERNQTGGCKPCKRRYDENYCVENKSLISQKNKKYRDANEEKMRVRRKEYYLANRKTLISKTTAYHKENKARRDEYLAAYLSEKREMVYAKQKEWRRANPERVRRNSRARELVEKRNTPVWSNQHARNAIYLEAQEMRDAGVDVHVDHIIPLRGKLVCGLHNEFNLRIVPAVENLRKSNKFEPCDHEFPAI